MKIEYAPRAIADLEDIARYLIARNPKGAANVRSAILRSLELVARFPHIGREQMAENVRKIGVRRYPYLIYYTVDAAAGEIVVLAVQHAAREQDYFDT